MAPDLVKVVEGGAVLVELLLADALGVTCQNLVLHLVDGPGDGGQELLPTHTQVLQGEGEREEIENGENNRRGGERNVLHCFKKQSDKGRLS